MPLELVPTRLRLFAPILVALAMFVAAPAAFAGKPSTGGTTGGGGKTDRTSPSVSISAPAAGATASGQITVKGSAGDNVGVSRVELSVDGGTYAAATGTTTWSRALDTASVGNGSHTVTARAADAAGNTSLATVTFTVANAAAPSDTTPPTVAIDTPGQGAAVPRQITVAGTAGDTSGVSKLEVKLDSGAFQTAGGTTSWTATVDASSAADGQHILTARATDAAGNVSSTSVTVVISDQPVAAPAMSSGTIGGYVFQESDRDGVYETGEAGLSGQYIYLYDASGTYLTNDATDANGWFEFNGRPAGTYTVAIAPVSWTSMRSDWVPDTTGTLQPRTTVNLADTTRVDLGMRRILRSTDASAPFSTYTGATGLTVKSYDDVVAAKDVYDRLMAGSLVDAEARYVTIRFDFVTSAVTTTMAVERNGVTEDFRATSNITWIGWISGDRELFHEYGHAWSMYYAKMVQQDATMAAYVRARGLEGDSRLNSSYAWDVEEMIAEDYRQLFGSPTAQAGGQLNRDVPLAKDVPGLRDFLTTSFRQPPQ